MEKKNSCSPTCGPFHPCCSPGCPYIRGFQVDGVDANRAVFINYGKNTTDNDGRGKGTMSAENDNTTEHDCNMKAVIYKNLQARVDRPGRAKGPIVVANDIAGQDKNMRVGDVNNSAGSDSQMENTDNDLNVRRGRGGSNNLGGWNTITRRTS